MSYIFKSGLYIPYDARKIRRKRLQLFYRLYREKHACCPKCGSDFIEETLMGYTLSSGSKYKDQNYAKCVDCKWKGNIHNMVRKIQ